MEACLDEVDGSRHVCRIRVGRRGKRGRSGQGLHPIPGPIVRADPGRAAKLSGTLAERKVVMYLGIEIGGTKLQLAVGPGDGSPFIDFKRAEIRLEEGAGGILRQIESVGRGLIERHQPRAMGIGFGGPVDAKAGRTITSHQVEGWTDFALVDWCRETFGLPAGLSNDCRRRRPGRGPFRGGPRPSRRLLYERRQRHRRRPGGRRPRLLRGSRDRLGDRPLAARVGCRRSARDGRVNLQWFRHRRGRAVLVGPGESPRSVRRRSTGPVWRPDGTAQRPDGRRSGCGRKRGGTADISPAPCKRSDGPLPR